MLFIFDMGGVVTSTFQMDSIYSRLNTTKADFFSICKLNGTDIWHNLETGMTDTNSFWSSFNLNVKKLQRLQYEDFKIDQLEIPSINNIPEVKHDLFRLYFHPVINPETVELIKALRKKHRVVCGTNTIQSHWENHVERGDYAYFDQTYASNKIGVAKPDPYFFELIMEAEGYTSKDVFFVDDKEENCKAAASVGINTELIKTPQQLYDKWIKYSD